ncbi:MAG: type VI secretion system protein TssA [Candidatus Competibacter denitrificans]
MSVLDVEALLSEIAPDALCGDDLEYDPEFVAMEKLAQETPERQYGDTVIPAEPPDWRSVRKSALSLLERTRDLRVAVYLARASLHADGLPGFADGLSLVQGLLERFWEGVHPQLDPDDGNDPMLRVNTIVALCDPETTLRGLRETPLVSTRAFGRLNLRDIQVASGALIPVGSNDQEGGPTRAAVDGAFQEADLEALQATAGTVTAAIERTQRIEAVLTEQVGVSQAPDMSALTDVLREMRQVLAEHLQRRGAGLISDTSAADATEEGSLLSGSATSGVQRLVVGEIGSREDAVRMLDRITDYFERHEPSSPVPFLLKRAKKLVAKDFMSILNDLAPGGAEQAILILGLQDQDSSN